MCTIVSKIGIVDNAEARIPLRSVTPNLLLHNRALRMDDVLYNQSTAAQAWLDDCFRTASTLKQYQRTVRIAAALNAALNSDTPPACGGIVHACG
ncbi:MAG TPA: hypothetical protein V6D20_17855 [Candidatus Obscuribacterales bacterium]